MGFSFSNALGKLTGGLFDSPDKLKVGSTLSGNQRGVSNLLSTYLQERIRKGLPAYGGQRVAPLSGMEQSAQGMLGRYMGGLGAYMPQRQAAYASTLAGNAVGGVNPQERIGQYHQNVGKYWQNQFKDLSTQAKEDAYATSGGRSGSAMNRALASSAENVAGQIGLGAQSVYEQALADQQARDLFNAQARIAAAQSDDPQRSAMLQNVMAGMEYGALPRELAQAALDTDYQMWMQEQPEYSPIIQQALAYLGTPMTTSYLEPQVGLLGQLQRGTGQFADTLANLNAMWRGQPSVQTQAQSKSGGSSGGFGLSSLMGGAGPFGGLLF